MLVEIVIQKKAYDSYQNNDLFVWFKLENNREVTDCDNDTIPD